MRERIGQFYEFGPFRLDPAERRLSREGVTVPLRPKVFDTLLLLVENSGHLIEKDELMRQLWPDRFVEENSLNKIISMLRHSLGESGGVDNYIETVPKCGYRFIANVRELRRGGGSNVVLEEHASLRVITEEEETINQATTVIASDQVISGNRKAFVQTEQSEGSAPLWNLIASKRQSLVIALGLVSLAVFGVLTWRNYSAERIKSEAAPRFGAINLSRLTTTGKAVIAAVSADGKYMTHVREESGKQSVWLRQVAEPRDIEIIPATDVEYWALCFSPNGNEIYYVAWEGNRTSAALYWVPVLGGPAKKLLDEIGSSITFAPDGRRFAYVNEFSSRGESFLMVANADGTGNRVLAARPYPLVFSSYPHSGPAWSPDGKFIVSSIGSFDKSGNKELVAVGVDDGVERPLAGPQWASIGSMAWFDASSLILVARELKAAPSQLWHVSYPTGQINKITNDLNDYSGVSTTRDLDTVLSVRRERIVHLVIMPNGVPDDQVAIASESGTGAGDESPTWTPDGKIVFRSNASGAQDIWIMNADGTERKQLTFGAGNNIHPTVSPDGRYIVFASDRTGTYHIWRMNIDGSNPRQVTNSENSEAYPQCSPNGRWVVYQNGYGWVKSTLWRVAIDGGEAKQLTNKMSIRPVISPDGKLIAYYYMDSNVWGLAVIASEGGSPIRTYQIAPTVKSRILRWLPDGKSVGYVDMRDGVSLILSQRLAGGPPMPITEFRSDQVFHFNWSPDGKQMLVSRGTETSDVTLVRVVR